MQPHSEVPTTTTKASATTTNSVSSKNPTTIKDNNINSHSPSFCKLVKGRRPLVNFNFYLDIKDQQISKKVEERITDLGGNLEFFLSKSVSHFITDRSLPAVVTSSTSGSQKPAQNSNSNYNNGNFLNSPSTGVGVNGGGVGGGGGGGVYPITPSPYLQSPQTPTTPKTPYTNQTYSGDSATDGIGSSHSRIKGASTNNTPNNKKKISRADAMLHRALQTTQSQQYSVNQPEEHKRPNLEQGAYRIWTLEYAIKFLKKVTADVKQFAKKSQHQQQQQQPTKGAGEPIQLKGHFIKIEAISGSHRPYYSVFRNIEWPKTQLDGEGGAFRLTPKRDQLKSIKSAKSAKDKPSKTNAMTRKSRSSSKHNPNHIRLKAKQVPKQGTEKAAVAVAVAVDNSSEKQCGVCEICKIEYDTLTIHLKTKDHEFFARNQNNYLALDTLIKSSGSVNKFLEDTSKDETKEESLEPMEIEEESSRSTRKSSRKQTPPPVIPATPPAIKIKTKLKEVEVVTASAASAATDKKPSHNNGRKSTKLNVPLDSPPIRHPLPTSTIYKVVADSKAQTDPVSPEKSSIIVKFRKIRQTEISLLNGEAENFMFPRRPTSSDRATDSDRQTSTDSNRISSSSISSESHLTEEPLAPERPDSATAKRKRIADKSHKSSTKTAAVCYQSFPNTPIQPNKSSQATRETPDTKYNSGVKAKPLSPTKQRKRHGIGNERKRRATSKSARNRRQKRWHSEDRMGEDGNIEYEEDDDYDEDEDQPEKLEIKDLDLNSIDSEDSPQKSPTRKTVKAVPPVDLNHGQIKNQMYAFERLPVKELWYEVFRRQDACQERMFEYWGSTSYRKLPYEIGAIPMRTLTNCQICTPCQKVDVKHEPIINKQLVKRIGKLTKIKKEKRSKSKASDMAEKTMGPKLKALKASKAHPFNKHLNKATFLSCDLMPRKSPREHASTLAILSCLIKQHKDSEGDKRVPTPPLKEKTPEKTKTPSPVVFAPRNDAPEPLQFVSEISENVKRLRRGQKKFEDFIPTNMPLSPKSKRKKKPPKPKGAGLEFEVDEKRLKSLETKQKSSVQLEQEIDAYLGRISMKALRHTPTLPNLSIHESSSSSGFVDDFTSDIDLIDLIDCYDGGGGGGGTEIKNENDSSRRPAINNIYNLFSEHNRRRKNNKVNKTGWPTTRRRNTISTRQNHLLQKSERFHFFCDYQTGQKNGGVQDQNLAPTATSMTPPDTDLDDKDDCTRSSVPDEEEEPSVICKDDILNNSCMSPSEKADNSDIFTVSSDGLDTDLDVSCNQIIKTEDIDDECTTSSTLAAQPPPAPPPVVVVASEPPEVIKVKSSPTPKTPLTLAMRSIIKREVKVSCKRMRTPFRRFRQRR